MKKNSYPFIIILAFVWIALLFSFAISKDTPMGSVSGRVISYNTHNPVYGAKIYHPAIDGRYVKTDKNGYYKLTNVPEGKYSLNVGAHAYEYSYQYNVDVFEGSETKNINFALYAKNPYFSVYMEKDTFTPKNKPSFICRGYKINKIAVKVYKFDLPQFLNKLEGDYNLKSVNLDSLKCVYEGNFKTEPDEFGDFEKTQQINASEKGYYIASITPDKAKEERLVFNITDLGIVVKRSKERLLVYAVNLLTGAPAQDVSVKLYDKNNDIINAGATDKYGLMTFTGTGGVKYNVVGFKNASYAFTRSFANDGDGKYKVYIYTERPVYRPNQTVYYKGIVRKDLYNKYENVAGKEIAVEVADTEGNIVEKTSVLTDSFGAFSGKVFVKDASPLGEYSIKAALEGEAYYGQFKVSEYKKPEFKVDLATAQKRYVSGDKVSVDINAAYYFGEPVRGAEVSYTVYTSPYYSPWLYSPGRFYDDYGSDFDNDSYGNVIDTGQTKLNADGFAKINISPQKTGRDQVIGVEVEVKDKSLRTVEGSISVVVTRGLFDIAVKPDKYVYAEGDTAKFEIKAADYDGKVCPNLDFKADIYKIDYVEGETQFEEKQTLLKTVNGQTNSKGAAAVSYKIEKSGSYKIESTSKDSRGNIISSDYYVWASSLYSSGPVSGSIEIITDKKVYNIGDKAKVLVNIPWKAAAALVTIEGADIYSAKVYRIDGFSKTINVPVTEQYFPNVYVEVSLVKDEQLIYRSAPLYINTKDKGLHIAVKPSKDKYKPGDTARYDIAVTDKNGKPARAELSLGVVDEAIYAIQEDATTDINKFFYGYRYKQIATNYSFSGYYSGGADKEAIKIRKKFEDTAYFNPAVVTDVQGKAKVSFVLPENLTTWRATLRGVTLDTLVGQAVNNIIVSKDLIVNLEVPRFITQGDALEVAGVVHNYTDKDIKAEINFKALGCVLEEKGAKTVEVKKNEALRVPFLIKAETAGTATFIITASSSASSDGMELSVPVLPHGIAQFKSQSQIVEKDAQWDINLPSGTIKNATELLVTLAPSVGSAMLGSLDYLVNYPYGCTEQTMNSFMPAVVVKDTLNRLNIVGAKGSSPLQNKLSKVIRSGLERLYSYQHPDGGWGWWEYDDTSAYLTGYVVLGLNEAKKCGVKIDKYSFDRGVAAVKAMLKQKEENFVGNNYIYEQNGYINARTYLLYVLSECGKVDKNDLIKIFQNIVGANGVRPSQGPSPLLNNYSKALLVLALDNEGLKKEAKKLFFELGKAAVVYADTCHWESKSARYSWEDSDIEATAFALKALIRVNPNDNRIIKCFNWLNQQKRGARWVSTKDTSVVLSALCDYLIAKGDANPDFTASLYLNKELINGRGGVTPPVRFNNIAAPVSVFNVPAKKIKDKNVMDVKKEGRGRLLADYCLKYFVREESIKPSSSGISVERRYFKLKIIKDFKGGYIEKPEPFSGGAVKEGEKLQVKLTLTCKDDYRYVLIEDMLPAGCEVDIAEGEKNWGSLWWKKQVVRDEKIVFFSSYMDKGKHELTYNLRCEIPGEYHVMPASAYLMYAPSVCGHSAEDRLKIR